MGRRAAIIVGGGLASEARGALESRAQVTVSAL